MAAASPIQLFERFRSRPLPPAPLVLLTMIVWLAGAIYCSGYERLMSGLDNWPGSLWWSAVAVLPWLALFEWSKSAHGRRTTDRAPVLALLLIGTAAASLVLEFAANAALGDRQPAFALALMRRLPALGVGLLLILWARSVRAEDAPADESLAALAPSVEWVAAADNYVELHMQGRTATRRMTMAEAERRLSRHGFVRIHRRFLVNRARLADCGKESVRLDDGTELPIGRAFAANLRSVR